MSEIYFRHKEIFDSLLEKYMRRHERWKWYFDQDSFSGDRCAAISLCDRLSDFDFLENFTVKERDSTILYYAIDAWQDMRQYAIKNRTDVEYMCHICLSEEDYNDEPILWPKLIFERAITHEVPQNSKQPTRKPESEFAKYIVTLLGELGHCKGVILRESVIPEKDRAIPGVVTHRLCIDFGLVKGEKRVPIPGYTI